MYFYLPFEVKIINKKEYSLGTYTEYKNNIEFAKLFLRIIHTNKK